METILLPADATMADISGAMPQDVAALHDKVMNKFETLVATTPLPIMNELPNGDNVVQFGTKKFLVLIKERAESAHNAQPTVASGNPKSGAATV